MKITALEKAFLTNLANSEYGDPEQLTAAPTWAWACTLGEITPRNVSGVVSSLVKKGLVHCEGYGKESTIGFTALGLATYKGFSG